MFNVSFTENYKHVFIFSGFESTQPIRLYYLLSRTLLDRKDVRPRGYLRRGYLPCRALLRGCGHCACHWEIRCRRLVFFFSSSNIPSGQDINEVLQQELQQKGISLNPQEIEEVLYTWPDIPISYAISYSYFLFPMSYFLFPISYFLFLFLFLFPISYSYFRGARVPVTDYQFPITIIFEFSRFPFTGYDFRLFRLLLPGHDSLPIPIRSLIADRRLPITLRFRLRLPISPMTVYQFPITMVITTAITIAITITNFSDDRLSISNYDGDYNCNYYCNDHDYDYGHYPDHDDNCVTITTITDYR
jgi:hypothetical protein